MQYLDDSFDQINHFEDQFALIFVDYLYWHYLIAIDGDDDDDGDYANDADYYATDNIPYLLVFLVDFEIVAAVAVVIVVAVVAVVFDFDC